MTYSRAVQDWSESVAECQICLASHWLVEREQRAGLTVAHIVPRSRRRCDEIWNLLLGCPRCHLDNEHGMNAPGWPTLTFEHLLWAKRESGIWRPDKLANLYGRRVPYLPEPQPLPERYFEERMNNHAPPPRVHDASTEAQKLMGGKEWKPWMHLSKVIEPDNSVRWEVRDGLFRTAKLLGSGMSDVEAIRDTLNQKGTT